MKRNLPIFGFTLGVIMPLIGLTVMYLLWGHKEGLWEFTTMLFRMPGQASKVFTLSLLANLLPFLYFMVKRLDYSLRGVVIATMLYAVLIVLIKFVW